MKKLTQPRTLRTARRNRFLCTLAAMLSVQISAIVSAGNFSLDWGTLDWPTNSFATQTYTLTDEFGFQISARIAIATKNGTAVTGYPDDITGFGTKESLSVAWDPTAGNSGIGESTVTLTFQFLSGSTSVPTNGLVFEVSDIDASDSNAANDRCDFVTFTGNAGNPTLATVAGTAATRSVIIGPRSGTGATGTIAANQAQCVYNTGTTASPVSSGDDLGTVRATYPTGTHTVTVAYDESIENVYGVTNRDAAARGTGYFAGTDFTVNNAVTLSKSTSATQFTVPGQTITYTYVVTNQGPLPLNTNQNIQIQDNKIGTFACGAISSAVPVGGTVTCTANYTVTAADFLAGTLTNVATAGVGTGTQSFATRLQSNASSVTLARAGTDFGDAPDGATGTGTGNYQTTGSDNGPSHTIVPGLRLGSVAPDADSGSLQNAAADADNTTGTNDEDGVTNFPVFTTTSGQTVTIPVDVTNTTGAAASLVGYLDFNKDGDFLDTGEQSGTVAVAPSATNPRSFNLSFTVPVGVTAGTTYARFRISSTASEVASPVGAASSGEVEDYQITLGSPDLTINKTHSGSFVRGSTGTYTLTVGNSGNQPTSGTITVTDTLPAGLSVNNGNAGTVTTGGTNAANWTCSSNAASPQVITCSSSAVIAATNGSSFTLNVNVAANAGTTSGNSVTNSAAVSGGGEAVANNGNNSKTDPTTTVAPTDLTLAKTHSGDFTVGGVGTYSFTVTNGGGVSSSGTITVTDTLPTGLSFVTGSTTGTSWSCSASSQTVTCTSSTVIAATGSSTFSFNVNVGVATAPGPNSVTNTAVVSGGGDSNTTNNNASDPTTVVSPDLTVSKSHTPSSFVQGGVGNYLIRVYNNTANSTAPTSGMVTVTDTLPSGLSVPAGAVTLTAGKTVWSCTASGQVITCTYTKTVATGSGSNLSFDVNVAPNAGTSLVNQASVSGGGEATANAGNNTTSDSTPTVDAGKLTLTKSVRNVTTNSATSTTVGSGEPGDVLEYCISYSNPGQSTVTNTVVSDTIPSTTTPLTTVFDYGNQAVRWRITQPSASTQNLSAAADADAGELGAVLTVRVGAVPAGGAGDVCFQAGIN